MIWRQDSPSPDADAARRTPGRRNRGPALLPLCGFAVPGADRPPSRGSISTGAPHPVGHPGPLIAARVAAIRPGDDRKAVAS